MVGRFTEESGEKSGCIARNWAMLLVSFYSHSIVLGGFELMS